MPDLGAVVPELPARPSLASDLGQRSQSHIGNDPQLPAGLPTLAARAAHARPCFLAEPIGITPARLWRALPQTRRVAQPMCLARPLAGQLRRIQSPVRSPDCVDVDTARPAATG